MKLPNVTVVVPTYNRANLINNLLLSLKYQSYPKEKYQVVIVDDFSKDTTLQICNNFKLENYTVIANKENKGPAYSRNIGWKASEGEVIVFCDSDFIVPKTYIENHAKAHVNDHSLAVSGMGHWNLVLTYDFKEQWSPYEKKHLKGEYLRPFITDRINQSIQPNLIIEEDIKQEMVSSFLIAPDNPLTIWSKMYDDLVEEFGYSLKGFRCPWVSFCTGNVSIRKNTLENLGGFDENFHVGYEDWEFAYRFYLDGGQFCFSKEIESYIQLTPRHPSRTTSVYNNFKIFREKHPALEIHLLKLDLEGKITLIELHNLLEQHDRIKAIHPSFIKLTNQFEEMARQYSKIPAVIYDSKSDNKTKKAYINEKREYLLKKHEFKDWLNLFDRFYYN